MGPWGGALESAFVTGHHFQDQCKCKGSAGGEEGARLFLSEVTPECRTRREGVTSRYPQGTAQSWTNTCGAGGGRGRVFKEAPPQEDKLIPQVPL